MLINEAKEFMREKVEGIIKSLESHHKAVEGISCQAEQKIFKDQERITQLKEVIKKKFELIRKALVQKELALLNGLDNNETNVNSLSGLITDAQDLIGNLSEALLTEKSALEKLFAMGPTPCLVHMAFSCYNEVSKKFEAIKKASDEICNYEIILNVDTFESEVKKVVDAIGLLNNVSMKKISLVGPNGLTVKDLKPSFACLEWNRNELDNEYIVALQKENEVWDPKTSLKTTENKCIVEPLDPDKEYKLSVQAKRGDLWSRWSEVTYIKTPKWSCAWKECPDSVKEKMKYSVDEKNPMITSMFGFTFTKHCTIIGNTPLLLNKVTSWNIKILKSLNNNGCGIYIGVAPSDINQNEENCKRCGWYFGCFESLLRSGPPHNYKSKEYGPRKDYGQYVHTGDSVGVVMDTTKGELSFVVDGVNLGVAFDGIPLDKPLVPCVILGYQGDSVKLII